MEVRSDDIITVSSKMS